MLIRVKTYINFPPGVYLATISFSNNCQEISNSYSLVITSCKKSARLKNDIDSTKSSKIKEELNLTNSSLDLKIYPNPNTGNFNVEFSSTKNEPYSLEIMDTFGKRIYYIEHLNVNSLGINQNNLPKGVYYLRATCGINSIVRKLIIQ